MDKILIVLMGAIIICFCRSFRSWQLWQLRRLRRHQLIRRRRRRVVTWCLILMIHQPQLQLFVHHLQRQLRRRHQTHLRPRPQRRPRQRQQTHPKQRYPPLTQTIFTFSKPPSGKPLEGKTFVFTGVLGTLDRNEAITKVCDLGGMNTGRVLSMVQRSKMDVVTKREVSTGKQRNCKTPARKDQLYSMRRVSSLCSASMLAPPHQPS